MAVLSYNLPHFSALEDETAPKAIKRIKRFADSDKITFRVILHHCLHQLLEHIMHILQCRRVYFIALHTIPRTRLWRAYTCSLDQTHGAAA